MNDTASVVEYGIGGLALRATGKSAPHTSMGTSPRTQYIHRVKLPNLTPQTKYCKYIF